MKKQYAVSSKAREWKKHLKPFGKRLANKSTRKLGKYPKTDKVAAKTKSGKKKPYLILIQWHAFNPEGRWDIYKRYTTANRRDKAFDAMVAKQMHRKWEMRYEFKKEDKIKTK